MPIRVLQLGPYPPPEGGVTRNMIAIGRELRASGHTCTFVATTRGHASVEEQDVLRPRPAIALLRLLATANFDVLHLHVGGEVTARVLALCAACAFFGRGRSVMTLHSGGFAMSDAARNAGRATIAGAIFRRFSRVIAVNEKLADVFRRFGVADYRLRVIPPFILERPYGNVAIPDKLKEFMAAHSPNLVAVGGLEKDYDPLFQIAAMSGILARHPRAGLMIVGDGSMRAEVEASVAESGCSDAICLAGNVEHVATLHLINDADILLRTTLFDGDAISIREALFLGTPVIATDTGGRTDGVALVKIGDSSGLIDAVSRIVARGKESEVAELTDNSNIAAVVRLYSELI